MKDDIVWLRHFLEAERFLSGDSFERVPAVVCLVGLCGVPAVRVPGLQRSDFDPTPGNAALDLTRVYADSFRQRRVPVIETARIVILRYFAKAPDQQPDAPLIQTQTGDRSRAPNIERQFRSAAERLGRPDMSLRQIRALYVRLLEDKRSPQTEQIISYLSGFSPGRQTPRTLTSGDSIPLATLRAFLEGALPLAQPWRLLTHRVGSRGAVRSLQSDISALSRQRRRGA